MTETIRSLVRPFVTVVAVLALTAFESHSVFVQGNKVSQEYVILVTGVVGFWFWERKQKKASVS